MPLVTAPRSASTADEAIALFAQHKIEKLPLVDDDGRLAGLITVKDFDKSEKYPHATKDAAGPPAASAPRSASSATPGSAPGRCVDAGVDVIVVDTANGTASRRVLDIVAPPQGRLGRSPRST